MTFLYYFPSKSINTNPKVYKQGMVIWTIVFIGSPVPQMYFVSIFLDFTLSLLSEFFGSHLWV